MSEKTMMYPLKPLISLPAVLNHSKVMYEMKNIHDECGRDDHMGPDSEAVTSITEQVINFLKEPLPEFSALEATQEKILAEIAELKKQVSTLCGFLKESLTTLSKVPITIDLVINANPNQPPYSLLALQKVWDNIDINIVSHIHSSIIGQVPSFHTKNTSSADRSLIRITLIWKEVDDLEIATGITGCPIRGEVNLLRYINRHLCTDIDEDLNKVINVGTLDQILDWCHTLTYLKTSSKNTQETLSLIESNLKKLADKEQNIANVALWSILKQISMKKVSQTLTKSLASCELVL